MQSYVLCPGYAHQSFFTIHTLDTVSEAITEALSAFVTAGIGLWSRFCAASYDDFVNRHKNLYVVFIEERRRAGETFYTEINKTNRLIQLGENSGGSGTGSSVRSASKRRVNGGLRAVVRQKKQQAAASKGGNQTKNQGGSKTPASSKSKKKKTAKKLDPDVFHRLKYFCVGLRCFCHFVLFLFCFIAFFLNLGLNISIISA